MLFHGKLGIRPALTVPLFALFGGKGFGGYAIEMFVHALTTPDSEIGSRDAVPMLRKSLQHFAKLPAGQVVIQAAIDPPTRDN